METPWKIGNEAHRLLLCPLARIRFMVRGIQWGKGWRFYGLPLILKHRRSVRRFGENLSLRSTLASNPLGPTHPTILCTWQAGAESEIGDHFGMTGVTICAAQRIVIGSNVTVGANTTIMDTDFHPLDPEARLVRPQDAKMAPILIGSDAFIGMDCLILKGVTIGAGRVVTRDVPCNTLVAGNPAQVLGLVK